MEKETQELLPLILVIILLIGAAAIMVVDNIKTRQLITERLEMYITTECK